MSPEGHFEVDFRCFFFYVPVAGGISSSLKYSIDIAKNVFCHNKGTMNSLNIGI